MIVKDNFLDKETFEHIKKRIFATNFPWYAQNFSDYSNDNNPQLQHLLFDNNIINSEDFLLFETLYEKLGVISMIRVKVLMTLKYEGLDNIFHTDIEALVKKHKKKIKSKTAIFYLNTNDGGTEFEDKQIVTSKENRIVIFNSDVKHRTIKHTTGYPYRYLVNINYF
jgi:hypothetical protein